MALHKLKVERRRAWLVRRAAGQVEPHDRVQSERRSW
jgi:hypothetical protein